MRARVFTLVPVLWCLASPSLAAAPAVAAAESTVTLAGGFAATAYSTRLFPGEAERSSGADLASGIAFLHSAMGGYDGYAALAYRRGGLSGGNAFNQLEARLGGGIPLGGSTEVIPYAEIGYQAWNRDSPGAATAFYRGMLAGGGTKLDVPVSPILVVSLDTSFLALSGGNAAAGQAVTPAEHVVLGLDDAAYGRLHVVAQAWWSRFTYGQPSTAATQSGVNLGFGYHFY